MYFQLKQYYNTFSETSSLNADIANYVILYVFCMNGNKRRFEESWILDVSSTMMNISLDPLHLHFHGVNLIKILI